MASEPLFSFLPWMRKRTHKRIYIAQGEAYRREIQEAHRDAERARADLRRFADSLAPRIHTQWDIPTGNLRIIVEVDQRLQVRRTRDDLLTHVRDSIMHRLMEIDRDYRGDLRQTPTQRALGL